MVFLGSGELGGVFPRSDGYGDEVGLLVVFRWAINQAGLRWVVWVTP